MFYYYGAKHQTARRYPQPFFRTTVEPFAGAAGYSVYHLSTGQIEKAILVELDPRPVELWKRLLAQTPEQIRSLRPPEPGTKTDDFLWISASASNAAAHTNSLTVTPRMYEDAFPSLIERIAILLPALQNRVEIIHDDYRNAPDIEATYFIDPPYAPDPNPATKTANPRGSGYKTPPLDYAELAEYCRTRNGQTIVCEQAPADWLPFAPFRSTHNSLMNPYEELIWTRTTHRTLFGLPS